MKNRFYLAVLFVFTLSVSYMLSMSNDHDDHEEKKIIENSQLANIPSYEPTDVSYEGKMPFYRFLSDNGVHSVTGIDTPQQVDQWDVKQLHVKCPLNWGWFFVDNQRVTSALAFHSKELDQHLQVFASRVVCSGVSYDNYILFSLLIDPKAQLKGLTPQGVRDLLSFTYKIHLQVKPEYLYSFVSDFFMYFTTKLSLNENIYCFKFTSTGGNNKYNQRIYSFNNNLPVMVLYIRPLSGPMAERQKVLDEIIFALIQRYGKYASTIALRHDDSNVVAARWNEKISDLIWICGGNGDDKESIRPPSKIPVGILPMIKSLKEELKNVSDDRKIECQQKIDTLTSIYTDDLHFVRGYEYDSSAAKRASALKETEALVN